ncbi:hypothetical protein F957_00240 [Acinetobacter gyllenbergii CIP 110306 = MTCC 11365]|uniref:Uncharacterized protein n=2 Tax=Acinetobacter gyllenbergii TaxID=134534 RepID=A0A829HMT6_9GAMM|nr:hypothetical protein F957_00240 [Acinetobacter gyllenbergii CIP 110306 = MTCC 11365]
MLKNFIYLDKDKMYSISSQMFEGIAQELLKEETFENEESESQDGPRFSGKVLADVVKNTTKSIEKKFLHDYSFTLFEKELNNKQIILDISDLSDREINEKINKYSFIKVTKEVTFNDHAELQALFSKFNQIGTAISRMQLAGEIDYLETLGQQKRNQYIKDKENSLHQDPKFLESFLLLSKHGYQDNFEVVQKINNILVTSYWNRDYLREDEQLIIRKYSRKTNVKISIIGTVSQYLEVNKAQPQDNFQSEELSSHMRNMFEHLTSVEYSISGKSDNEIVIDPIAAYIEL